MRKEIKIRKKEGWGEDKKGMIEKIGIRDGDNNENCMKKKFNKKKAYGRGRK